MAAAGGRKLNKLASTVAKLTSPLPKDYKAWGYTFAFDSWVSDGGCHLCGCLEKTGLSHDT